MFLTDTPTHLMLDRAKPGGVARSPGPPWGAAAPILRNARHYFICCSRNLRRNFRIKSCPGKIYFMDRQKNLVRCDWSYSDPPADLDTLEEKKPMKTMMLAAAAVLALGIGSAA